MIFIKYPAKLTCWDWYLSRKKWNNISKRIVKKRFVWHCLERIRQFTAGRKEHLASKGERFFLFQRESFIIIPGGLIIMEKKKEYGKFLIAALQVCLVAAFPAIFLYCRNADQADFYEIVPALLLFCGMGLFLLLCSLIVTRSSEKAVISATILTLVMTNFSFLESLLKLPFPYIKYWHENCKCKLDTCTVEIS